MKILSPFVTSSIVAASIVFATTAQTHALSCAPNSFDLETVFKANKQSGNNVVYVMGSFSGKQTNTKKSVTKKKPGNGIKLINPNREPMVSNLSFSGKIMTKNGAKPFKQKVKVTATCIASWCGYIPKSGQQTIAALTKTKTGYTLTTGPCSPNTFSRQIETDWSKLNRLVR